MSKFLFILLLIPSLSFADEWTYADTKREAVYQSLWAVDWMQTHTIAAHPNKWHEENSYLGLHPSNGAVNRYFFAGSVLHVAAAYLLPAEYRAPFQYITIGIEGGYVTHNFSIGISAKF